MTIAGETAQRPEQGRARRVEFCDTNVLVYAYDLSAGAKRDQARALLERLWLEQSGALSVQVLQELFVTLTRKVTRPLGGSEVRAVVADMATWRVVEPTVAHVMAAIEGTQRWQLSFWDAMIITSALHAGAAIVWSEDMNHGQIFDGLTVRNPFERLTGQGT